jgi:hypothetical protein
MWLSRGSLPPQCSRVDDAALDGLEQLSAQLAERSRPAGATRIELSTDYQAMFHVLFKTCFVGRRSRIFNDRYCSPRCRVGIGERLARHGDTEKIVLPSKLPLPSPPDNSKCTLP